MQRQLSGEDPGMTTEGAPPLGRYYDVAGRRLLLHRSGSGSPAVVFLPGGGAVGLDYLNVQERAAQLTTSVIYDRAGTGWSDRVELPRSSAEVTGELRELLRTAGVPGPYLLVGHSLGGFYARHYAHRFPAAVSGGTPEALLREEIDGKRRLYTALAESVSQGENRLVDGVGHVTLHLRRPDAVAQAIQDLLARIGG